MKIEKGIEYAGKLEHLAQEDHFVNYLLSVAEPRTRCIDNDVKHASFPIARQAQTDITILTVGEQQYWIKTSEWNAIQDTILSANKIYSVVYKVGSTSPYLDETDKLLASGIDGYKIEITFK